MKCLSVRQPWADLIVNGKRFLEIRKWLTKYRGKILIHASLKIEKHECQRLNISPGYTGAIIGIVDLVSIKKLSKAEWSRMRHLHLEVGSRPYGEKTFAWIFRNPKKLTKPLPFVGKLGLFNVDVPDELVKHLK